MKSLNANAVSVPRPQRTFAVRRAFSLIELLVVIGIVVMLITVLIPAVRYARDQANTAACLSNLRQVGTAFAAYRANNAGLMPPVYVAPVDAQVPEGLRTRWASRFLFTSDVQSARRSGGDADSVQPLRYKVWADLLIDAGFVTRSAFACGPASGVGLVGPGRDDLYPSIEDFLPYSINGYLVSGRGRLLGQSGDGFGVGNAPGKNPRLSVFRPWPFPLITRPAEGLLVIDNFVGLQETHRAHITAVGNLFNVQTNKRDKAFRHQNGRATNVLFFDGHVETRTPGKAEKGKQDVIFDGPPFSNPPVFEGGTAGQEDRWLLENQPSALWRPWKPYFP